MLSLFGVLLCALANRMRGMPQWGKAVGTAIILLALWVYGTVPYIWIAILGGLWLLGASFGWTKWILGMQDYPQGTWNDRFLKDETGRKDGSFFITRAIANGLGVYESVDYRPFCDIGFFVRGLYWWVPFYAAVGYMQQAIFWPAVAAVATAIWLPASYRFAYDKLGPKPPKAKHEEGLFGWRYLERAEPLYGLIYGLIMWFVLVWSPNLPLG